MKQHHVSVETVTPGHQNREAGLQVAYGYHTSRSGTYLIGLAEGRICWLSFVDGKGRKEALHELSSQFRGARLVEQTKREATMARKVCSGLGNGKSTSLGLLLMGTDFQIKVWRALLTIPAGEVVSYQALGKLAGAPKAHRAVGAAVGRNPIAYLIPCHRVIRKTGALGGYRWGEARKRTMLEIETAATSPRRSASRLRAS